MTLRRLLTAGLLILALPHGLSAQDAPVDVFAGGALELTFPRDGDVRELSAYTEVERNGFYGGFGALLSNDAASNELSLYFGHRGTTASGLDHDLSYTRYAYPADGGDCCGELGLALGYPVTETLALSTEALYDPGSTDAEFHVGAEYSLSDRVSLSADFGLLRPGDEPNGREWDAGVTYGLNDTTAVDVRYHENADGEGYLGLALIFDTTIGGGNGPDPDESPAGFDIASDLSDEE